MRRCKWSHLQVLKSSGKKYFCPSYVDMYSHLIIIYISLLVPFYKPTRQVRILNKKKALIIGTGQIESPNKRTTLDENLYA